MFRKLLAILPLIAAPAFAQEAVSATYGADLVAQSADMPLGLGAKSEPGSVELRTENGQPGAPATLMFGISPAAAHLGIVGIDAWLLVDPIAITGSMPFEDNGESAVTLPLTDASVGAQVYVQAATIWFDEDGAHAGFSNGLAMTIEG